MKKFLSSLCLSLFMFLFPIPTFAAPWTNILGYTPYAYEEIDVTTLAVSRLSAVYRETSGAVFITVETNDIRFRIEGGDPDANSGHLVDSATMQSVWLFDLASIRNFRAIAIGGNSRLIVTYYRRN